MSRLNVVEDIEGGFIHIVQAGLGGVRTVTIQLSDLNYAIERLLKAKQKFQTKEDNEHDQTVRFMGKQQ